jgi:hypothetical protein
MASEGWIVWSKSEHRMAVTSLFPSESDANAAIERLRGSDPSYVTNAKPDELVAARVE